MGLAIGDIVALTYGSTFDGDQIRYTLHYRVTVAGSSTTAELDLQAMADNFANNATNTLTAALQAVTESAFNFDFVSAQRVWPARTIRLIKLSSFPGTVADTPMPTNVSIVITKRTLTPGRMGIGSLHLSGIPAGAVTSSQVANPATYSTLLTLLADGRTVPAVTMSIEPGLFNPTRPATFFSRLFDCQLQTTTRVMRRRTLRVGI